MSNATNIARLAFPNATREQFVWLCLREVKVSNRVSIFLAVPYAVIFLLSVLGNCLVILTLVRHKKMRTVTNVYLLNLAVSDLLLAVFCMPFTLVPMMMQAFIFGSVMCVLIRYLQVEGDALEGDAVEGDAVEVDAVEGDAVEGDAVEEMQWKWMQWKEMQWKGMQWKGMQWNWIQWKGMQWKGMQWKGMQWNWIQWKGMQWKGMQWKGMQWNWIQWKWMQAVVERHAGGSNLDGYIEYDS
ncbi:hypothetical protein ACOMHN_012861 [Nucella lapillus]